MKSLVLPLNPSRCLDFFRLHSEANGAGWCRCVAWWVPTWHGWGDRTAEENHALRQTLFDSGQYDGYLLYLDDTPAGWCQCGQRDRLAKLCESYRLSPDPAVWAVSCFFIAPPFRARGWAHWLLREVIADLAKKGISCVQGFPRRGVAMPPDDVWTGPESLFLRAGFALKRDDPERPIYVKHLQG